MILTFGLFCKSSLASVGVLTVLTQNFEKQRRWFNLESRGQTLIVKSKLMNIND